MKLKEDLAESYGKYISRSTWIILADAYQSGFNWALELAAREIEASDGISKGEVADKIRKIGEEEVKNG